MTDFRALCAELANSVELLLEMRAVDAKPMAITEDRLSRTIAALAQPEPEGVSYERLLTGLKSLIEKFDKENCTTICELEPW